MVWLPQFWGTQASYFEPPQEIVEVLIKKMNIVKGKEGVRGDRL